MLRRAICLVALLAVGTQACGFGGDKGVEIDRIEHAVPVELEVTLKGDVEVTFHETVDSRFVVRRTKNKDEAAQNTQFVGTEPAAPIKYGSGAFLAGVGIAPYVGDGEYTIPVGSPYDDIMQSQKSGQQPKVGSSIKVDWWPTGEVMNGAETFMRRAKPCTVVVKNNGTEGTVTCPDVTNEAQDKHFSMTLRWRAPAQASSPPSTSVPAP